MAVLVGDGVLLPCRVDDIINHPDGGEEEEDDEEDLQVRGADVYVAVGAAADQGAAQDQDVDTDDPGEHPSPVPAALPDNPAGSDVPLGLTGALRLARRTAVVGQVRLLRLLLFDHHPAGLTGVAISQTLTGIAAVQTHVSPLAL